MTRKNILTFIVAAVFILLVIAGVFWLGKGGQSGSWVCQEGKWEKIGEPPNPAPADGCYPAEEEIAFNGVFAGHDNGSATIKKDSGEVIKFKLSDETEYYGIDGSPVSAEEVRAGFSVSATIIRKYGNENFLKMIKIIKEPNILVEEPVAGQVIGLPLIVRGEARVFENQLNFRIKDSAGSVLAEGVVMASSSDAGKYGPFEVNGNYPEPKTDSGEVEIFDYSAKDGSEIDKVTIAVKFGKVDALKIKAYFGNSKKDPGAVDCSNVYPLERRIPKTKAVARAALTELLAGPDILEQDEGYFTSINPGVRIRMLKIEDGVARVDFDEAIQRSIGGSCRVSAIRSQIEKTLLQFEEVKRVIISVEGRTDDILQP